MDLFGKKQLRQENEELEEELQEVKKERDRLQERLEAEQERLTAARRDRQDAEERVNRLEDRIRSLRDRLDEDVEDPGDRRHTTAVGRGKVLGLLENLDAISYAAGESRTEITGQEARFSDPWLLDVVFETPLPMEEMERTDHGFVIDPLREQLQDRYLFVHVTAGGSGIAVIEDGEIAQAETIQADVKEQHGKGGYSQDRFERLREQQIEDHLDDVLPVLEEFSDAAYSRCIVTGSRQLRGRVQEESGIEATELSSDVGSISDKDDLERSFDSAMGCLLHRLPPDA